MAVCFGPLPAASLTTARPPRKDLFSKPPRGQRGHRGHRRRRTRSTYLEDKNEKNLFSSTYQSFRDSIEEEMNQESGKCRKRTVSCRISRPEEALEVRKRSWRAVDGYYSDTTLLPSATLSTFKSDDNSFENALLLTEKEKSKSTHNLTETKKRLSPRLKQVAAPVAKVEKRHRSVHFDETAKPKLPKCEFSVLKSELPALTYLELKKSGNTLHPKCLLSTGRYTSLHITVFHGNECVNPPKKAPFDPSYFESEKAVGYLRDTVSSLQRKKSFDRESFKGSLFRSQSEGNLAKTSNPDKSFNKYLRALSGSWRNLLNLGGMSRSSKSTPMAKKVAPPAVPDVFRHSGSSFGSAGYASSEDGFLPLPPDGQTNVNDRNETYGISGKSPGPGGQFNYQSFTFPGKGLPLYYHHQQSLQEDQGIDMTQSPGRDSPGSSGSGSGSGSRHSTASLDSGRASGSHFLGSRIPGGSNLSCSPRCSISSTSIVSSEHSGPGGRVERLIHQGVPDQDVVHAWLQDLHFEEYFTLFVAAGYDMPTISKMTPEDLTAIGIKKPNHRKKLKAEIAQLNISDGLPDYIPGSMEEWLKLLRLEEYIPSFRDQGYQSVEDVTQLAWEDLEDAGVVKLGHQKRLLLAIKRVKDIRAGKIKPHTPSVTHVTQAELHTPSPGSIEVGYYHPMTRSYHQLWDMEPQIQLSACQSPYSPDIVPIKIRGGRGKSLESLEDGERTGTHHTFSPENTATFFYPTLQLQSGGRWRRSYDDGDITPTNDAMVALHEGGGTLPRPRGLIRPRPIAKIPASRNTTSHYFEKPSYDIYDVKKFSPDSLKSNDIQSDVSCDLQDKCVVPPSMAPIIGVYDYKYRYSVAESNSGLIHNSSVLIHHNPTTATMRRRPPSPPKRQSSHSSDFQTPIDCNPTRDNGMIQQTTVVELHTHSSVPLPTYNVSSSPTELSSHLETLHLGWQNDAAEEEEQHLISALAQQARNGSDGSCKSSSSTESDSLPFANENAGTIKQRSRCPTNEYSNETRNLSDQGQEPADVLSDIGNMLANLTDELDAMLEEEKKQGLILD